MKDTGKATPLFLRDVDSQIQFKIHRNHKAKPHVEYLSAVGSSINYDARRSCFPLGVVYCHL